MQTNQTPKRNKIQKKKRGLKRIEKEKNEPAKLVGSRIRKSVVEIGCYLSVSNKISHSCLETSECFIQVSDEVQRQPVVPAPEPL